jgi:hypothetical protein
MLKYYRAVLLSCILSAPSWAQPQISGCSIFPSDNIWNTPIDNVPISADSAALINTIGATRYVHADFGSGTWNGSPIGIPFVVVPGTQLRVPVSFYYADESDPGPYPIPLNPPIEGGSQSTGDRHILILDRDNCFLYELYRAFPQLDGSWTAGSGAIYDLRSHKLRPASWTSADAAGLPMLSGLIRYEEILAGEIRHAIRFTAPQTRRQYVWPARHYASQITDPNYPPMGQRFRLKASYDISGFSPQVQVILRAMKKYGIILADNGGVGSQWFIGGVPDERWNNDMLRELHKIIGSNMEAVDVSSLMIDPNSGQARGTNSVDLTITPTSLTAGTSAQGQVRLSQVAPSGGAIVSLYTSNAAVAVPPVTVTVPAGSVSAVFPISTKSVSTPTQVTITATYIGASDTAVLTVNPVPANSPPAPVSVTPNSGRAYTQTFAFVYQDANGAADLTVVDARFRLDATKSCWIQYDRRTNVLRLMNATAPLQNSYCTINTSSATASGNRLTVTVAITFKLAFAGVHPIYAKALDQKGAASNWVQLGSWIVR